MVLHGREWKPYIIIRISLPCPVLCLEIAFSGLVDGLRSSRVSLCKSLLPPALLSIPSRPIASQRIQFEPATMQSHFNSHSNVLKLMQ